MSEVAYQAGVGEICNDLNAAEQARRRDDRRIERRLPRTRGNEMAQPFPMVIDDAGTPFAVVVIPVDDKLAIKAQPRP